MINKKEKTVKYVGLSFCQVLTLILITLKLIGVISWSWLLVFMPLIGELAAGLLLLGFLLMIGGITIGKWK